MRKIFSGSPCSYNALEGLPDIKDDNPGGLWFALPEFCGVVATAEASVHLVQNNDIFNVSISFLGMLMER